MKKIILYILLPLIISIVTIGMTAVAKTTAAETQPIKGSVLIAEDPTFKPTLTPKPPFLPGPSEEEQKKTGTRSLLVNTILPFLAVGAIGFVGGMSLIFLIIGGVRLATAYGNEEAIQKGKDQLMYALIGLVIAILSYTIVTIIIRLEFAKQPQSTTPAASYIPIEKLISINEKNLNNYNKRTAV